MRERRDNEKPLATTSLYYNHASSSPPDSSSNNSSHNGHDTTTATTRRSVPVVAMTGGDVIPLPTRMVLSAFAGMGAATFCHPLDVIRVQMQNFSYKGTWDAARSIYRSAGLVNGLYSGISAAYLRQWMYGSFRMGIYSYLLEAAKQRSNGDNITFATKLSMGCISGGIGSFVGTPSEVALVRMSADSKLPPRERRNYSNVFNCLIRIFREEGPTKLWRGATPTVMRATLLSSASLGVTSQAKSALSESGWFGPDGSMLGGIPVMFFATLVSSLCANIVANPFDVIKSRLQQMPVTANGTALYNGMGDCIIKSIRADGPFVLYKGFTPAFIKLAPYSIISLTLADKLTRAVTGKDAL